MSRDEPALIPNYKSLNNTAQGSIKFKLKCFYLFFFTSQVVSHVMLKWRGKSQNVLQLFLSTNLQTGRFRNLQSFEIKFQRKRLSKKIKRMWWGRFWFIKYELRSWLTETDTTQTMDFGISSPAGTWVFWPHCPQSAIPSSTFPHLQRQELPLIEGSVQFGLGVHTLYLQFRCSINSQSMEKNNMVATAFRELSFIPRLSLTEFCNNNRLGIVPLVNSKKFYKWEYWNLH